jgi:hypothetical protein
VSVDRISLGQLVKSNAGRDYGSIYLVIGFDKPTIALLADGRNRSSISPKKKNIRHISVLGSINKGVAARLAGDETMKDEEIRQVIRTCVYTGEK